MPAVTVPPMIPSAKIILTGNVFAHLGNKLRMLGFYVLNIKRMSRETINQNDGTKRR